MRTKRPQPRRVFLGSWTLPSGNSCDVYLTPDGHGPGVDRTDFLLDREPPWPDRPLDMLDYEARVLPAVLTAVGVYKDVPVRPAVVVRL